MTKRTKFNIGIRLFIAGTLLLCGQLVFGIAALASVPNWNYNGGLLATGLTAEQQKAHDELLASMKKEMQTLVADSQKGFIDEKEIGSRIETINKKLTDMTAEQHKELKKSMDDLAKKNEDDLKKYLGEIEETKTALKTQSEEIKKLKEAGEKKTFGEKLRSFKTALTEALLEKTDIIKDVNDDYGQRKSIKGFFEKDMAKASFTLKAVDMFESNIAQPNVNEYRLTELDGQRVGIPLAVYPHMTEVMMTKPMSRPYMALLVVYDYQDGSDTKAEGVASNQSSFLLKTVLFKAFYIATYFTLSDETLDDLDEVIAEINAIAPDKILSKIDGKVLSTTGDDSTEIKGLRTTGATGKCTAFDLNLIEVPAANYVDVFMAAKLQAENAGYIANVVMISPSTEMLLSAKKNTLNDSIQDRRIAFDNLGRPTFIGGMRIITNSAIPNNQAIIADNKLMWIGKRRDMTMEIGYNGTDLTEGQKTVVFKIRIAFGVRDKAGIIWVSNIDNAVANITPS